MREKISNAMCSFRKMMLAYTNNNFPSNAVVQQDQRSVKQASKYAH